MTPLVSRAGIVFALTATLMSAALHAQDSASASFPQLRHGFWLSVGLGYGRLDFSCGGGTDPWDSTPPAETCPEAGRARATLLFLRAGYTLSQQVLLGVSVDAWGRVGSSDGAVDLGVAVRGYPVRSRGLFAEAGVSRSEFGTHGVGPDEVGRGVGLVAGIGWDLRVDTNMSLSPVIHLHYGYQGDTGMPTVIHFPDGSRLALRTRVHETLVTFGLALTFH